MSLEAQFEALRNLDLTRPAEELLSEIEAMMQEPQQLLELATAKLSRIRRRLPTLEAPVTQSAVHIATQLIRVADREDSDTIRIRAAGMDTVEVRWLGWRYSWLVSSCPRKWPQVRVRVFWWDMDNPEKQTLSSQYLYTAQSVLNHLRQHGPTDSLEAK